MSNTLLRIYKPLTENEMAITIIAISLVILFLLWVNNPLKQKKSNLKNTYQKKPDKTRKITLVILILILAFGIYIGVRNLIEN